ncbi:carboxypeptidase-like regulatory domain-containing protein [Joostella sp. CR20]|uniref:carboxypeptidase-like regulatory domain-containing protein n=1 Tax=Joostella sp. CR20 TaxID=2804312 RepID=UPI00313C0583
MKYVIFIWICVYVNCCFGQQSIKGYVLDLRNNQPIYAASITVENSFQHVQTTTDGLFYLDDISKGDHILKISKEGYQTLRLPVVVTGEENIDLGEIFLEVDLVELQQENNITLSDTDFTDDVDTDFSSGSLQATRDIFTTRAAFDFSQSFFKIKGYDAKYGDVLINGIRMNRVFNGRPQWSNFGGINDILRNQEDFYGLEATPYNFGGVLGTSYINTDPSKFRPGMRISASSSNKSYRGRFMATYSSGLKNSGLSYSISASRRWGNEGFVDGTLYDAFSVFGAVGYQLKNKHNFYVSAFYTPNRRGKSAAITEEVFELVGRHYNPYWGMQNGVIRNSRIRKIEEPIFMFNYEFSGMKLQANLAAAYQFGKYSSSRLGYYNAASPNPDYYRYLPSFYINNPLGANFENANLARDGFVNNPQVHWGNLYNANSEENKSASYLLYDDTTDEQILSFNGNASYTFTDYFKLDGGFQYANSESQNYGQLTDLLGATFHEDIDPFSETKNDVNGSVHKIEGDKIGYHYDMNTIRYEGFLQVNFQWERLAFFGSIRSSNTSYQRNGLFLNERFPITSLGKSEKLSFSNISYKGGITYTLNNRHRFSVLGTRTNMAPTLQNSFVNARENNKVVESLKSEEITSATLSYYLNLPQITMRLTGFYTTFSNGTDINYFYVDAGVGSDFVQEVVIDIEKRHLGGELGFTYQATTEIKLSAVASYGDYRFTDNADVQINFDTVGAENELINLIGTLDLGEATLKDYKLSVGPQKAFSVGVDYRSQHYWWVGATANYLADNYVDISAIKRTQSFLQNPEGGSFPNATPEAVEKLLVQERLTPVYLLNLTGGKSWLIGKKYLSVFASVNNLFDVSYRTGGYEQSRNANFEQAFNDVQRGAPQFGNKYWYGYGRTYFLNFAISF